MCREAGFIVTDYLISYLEWRVPKNTRLVLGKVHVEINCKLAIMICLGRLNSTNIN